MQIQVPCFCLEFGKPERRIRTGRIPYQMVELQDLNNRPAIQELLDRFSKGDLDQRIAQLAAWHVADGASWQTLAQSSSRVRTGVAAAACWPEIALCQAAFPNRCHPIAGSPAWGIVQPFGNPR